MYEVSVCELNKAPDGLLKLFLLPLRFFPPVERESGRKKMSPTDMSQTAHSFLDKKKVYS